MNTYPKYTAMDQFSMLKTEIAHLEIEIAMKTKHLIALHCKAETVRMANRLDVVTNPNIAKAFAIDELPRTL